ncbi:MAG: 30S ribosomal protein S16 [Pseudomonadota bacterium]
MAVTIRLTKTGRKNFHFYRVVVADQRRKRDGRNIEMVGRYDPRDKTLKGLTLKSDRISYWVGKGARPTARVAHLIKNFAKLSQPKSA